MLQRPSFRYQHLILPLSLLFPGVYFRELNVYYYTIKSLKPKEKLPFIIILILSLVNVFIVYGQH